MNAETLLQVLSAGNAVANEYEPREDHQFTLSDLMLNLAQVGFGILA